MTRIPFKTLAVLAVSTFAATSLMAAPVLTNGDFELAPPAALGNNLSNPAAAAPWIFGAGNAPNVVKVDGPGGYEYYSNGPEFDASGAPAGVEQHYLDIANGANDFYQVFTPLCTGEVVYSAAFSTRANSAGEAGITILADADGSIVGPRQAVTLAGGASKTDPWTFVSFSTALTANTAYRFHVDMNNNMNMDNAEVQFQTNCPAHSDPVVTTEKTCEAPVPQPDGSILWPCQINVSFPSGAGTDPSGQPLPITVSDTWTVNGTPISGVVTTTGSPDNWNCSPVYPTGAPGDSNETQCNLFAPDIPTGGSSVINVNTVFPAGTSGLLSNCAEANPGTGEESCVTVVVDKPQPPKPKQCEAFVPEVTCNKVTGKPVVTLKNKYANLFSPKSVKVTSLTPGVSVQQSQSNALSVQLTGAGPGDTISLTTEAIEKGAGSEPGLDLCCMGEIEVKIPEGFICEPEQVLEVTKTCDTGINPAIDTDADCEITVHYQGPPPSASNPIKIVEAVTGNPWAFTTTPLSGDNWNCPAVPDATPFTCTISAADEPGANWQNWTSTLIVQMSVGETFENCVTATAAGGLEDRVCWSTETPVLTIEKLADQALCKSGEPCTFTINVSNPSGVNYTGPITLSDQINGASPPVITDAGTLTSITPALCNPSDLNAGTCTGLVSIPAGGTQSYSVTWLPPALIAGADGTTVTNCVQGVSANGTMSVANAPDGTFGEPAFAQGTSCANVDLLPPDVSISKTGPDQCLPGQPCDYQVTISAGTGGFNGPILLADQAPAGFQVTSITPMPVGCGANLPADTLACVVPVSLTAGESVSYTIAITPMGNTLDTDYFGENCALLGSVSEGAGPADYSYSGDEMSEEMTGLLNTTTMLGEACAPVVWTLDEGGSVEIVKNCVPLAQEDSPVLSYAMACTITANVTGQLSGQVSVTDVFQPAASGTGTVGPITPISGNWNCTGATCLIGPTGPGSYQMSVTVTGIRLDKDETVTNCANSYEVPVPDGVNTPLPVVNESCVTLTLPNADDPVGDSTLTATKTCGPATQFTADGLSAAECTITVSGTGTLPETIQLHESMLSYAGASHAGGSSPLNITNMTSTENWQFPPLPMAQATPGGGAAPPAIATLSGAELQAAGGTSTVNVTVQFQDSGWAMESQNCAQAFGGDAAGNPLVPPLQSELVCAQFETPLPKPDALTVTKTCTPSLEQGDTDQDHIPDSLTCQITVTVAPGYGNGLIVLEDFLQDWTQAQANVATISSITSTDPWDCTATGQMTGPGTAYCTILSDDMAGSTSTLTVTMADGPDKTYGNYSNCVRHTDAAGSGYAQTPFACAPISYPSGAGKVAGTPVLTVTKTATGPCVPDVAAQTYACGFDLTVTNTGSGAFAGPMVLGDAFDPGMVAAVTANSAGWQCNLAGDAASCINGNLSLASGASSSVALNVTVAGQPEGGTFTNCGSIGASDDPTAQAMIVQTALTLMGVDIGAVDGVPGKRTRAAVADLQKQLGLEATGEIDAGLLTALGVPMAADAEKSCVTVDLPPMPRPPLQCEKATTTLVDGACVCRFKNMYQADKTSCGCVKGTKFVAGEGCIKTKDKPKEDKPAALKCDPNSTVLRNGKCQCREEGMERVSKTACAKAKKQPEVKICPNGLPEIPGVGCVEIKLKRKEKEDVCDPAIDPERCG